MTEGTGSPSTAHAAAHAPPSRGRWVLYIVLAAASNTLVKGGLVWALSTPGMRRLVTPAVLGAVAGSVALAFAL